MVGQVGLLGRDEHQLPVRGRSHNEAARAHGRPLRLQSQRLVIVFIDFKVHFEVVTSYFVYIAGYSCDWASTELHLTDPRITT